MNYIKRVLFPMQNCEEIALYLFNTLRIPIKRSTLVNSLLAHPDYPSLLSISDILSNYDIDNMSLRINNQEGIIGLPTPFIAQIESEIEKKTLFALIYNINNQYVDWYNPEKHSREKISYKIFNTLFKKIVQVYDLENIVKTNKQSIK